MRILIVIILAVQLAAQQRIVVDPLDGRLHAVPRTGAWHKYTLTKIASETNACSAYLTSAATQSVGMGLDDATSGGANTGGLDGVGTYTVTIATEGTPDTFTWNFDGGMESEAVAITGAAQTLASGITITFAATTGHTAMDAWEIDITDSGCWQVNGVLGADAETDMSQDVVLFQLPATGYVEATRMKTSVAFTGATTTTIDLGTATDQDRYSATVYDLKAAVAATNIRDEAEGVGSTTAAAVNIVAQIVTTTETVADIVVGGTIEIWMKWGTVQ